MRANIRSGCWRAGTGLALLLLPHPMLNAAPPQTQAQTPAHTQAQTPAGEEAPLDVLTPWSRMKVQRAERQTPRVNPPRKGRKTCINVENMAGAQLFGDAAIELTMRDGKQWRMYFARECPGLSFYQGFYYRRGKANMLCAGRDVVGARSGGECRIASIMPVKTP